MAGDLEQRLDDLHARGVDTVRVNYGDMHGIARGKDLPLEEFGAAVAALAADPEVAAKSGRVFASWTLANEYGIEDRDGRRHHRPQ